MPDPAAFFAGMIRGVVVETRDGQLVLKVGKVTNEWSHSKAENAKAMIGKNVLVEPGDHDSIRRFVAMAKPGEEMTLDVAHREGESLIILELTEDQRELVKQ